MNDSIIPREAAEKGNRPGRTSLRYTSLPTRATMSLTSCLRKTSFTSQAGTQLVTSKNLAAGCQSWLLSHSNLNNIKAMYHELPMNCRSTKYENSNKQTINYKQCMYGNIFNMLYIYICRNGKRHNDTSLQLNRNSRIGLWLIQILR